MKLGQSVAEIDIEARRLRVADGPTIRFAHLDGADGVNSIVARTIFGRSSNPRTIGFGLEVEIPRELLSQRDNSVDIYFAITQWGYGWVFPKMKTFTIGVGGIHESNTSMKACLERFLTRYGLTLDALRVKGQYIPFGDFRRRPGRTCHPLCGDAGGFVDPVTGEGISYAMQSGRAAAHAILDARTAGKPDIALDKYIQRISPIMSSLRMANRWK
ncbi:MAG: NAD(P)/FAD-dependent oxidoreductase [Methylocella sp.]